jgi:hypothetical protein
MIWNSGGTCYLGFKRGFCILITNGRVYTSPFGDKITYRNASDAMVISPRELGRWLD